MIANNERMLHAPNDGRDGARCATRPGAQRHSTYALHGMPAAGVAERVELMRRRYWSGLDLHTGEPSDDVAQDAAKARRQQQLKRRRKR